MKNKIKRVECEGFIWLIDEDLIWFEQEWHLIKKPINEEELKTMNEEEVGKLADELLTKEFEKLKKPIIVDEEVKKLAKELIAKELKELEEWGAF